MGVCGCHTEQATRSLDDVHRDLSCVIDEQTVLVGHSLDSDLQALKLVHVLVVDTAALYPHPRGIPFKHSLKRLAQDVLGRTVQEQTEGTGCRLTMMVMNDVQDGDSDGDGDDNDNDHFAIRS